MDRSTVGGGRDVPAAKTGALEPKTFVHRSRCGPFLSTRCSTPSLPGAEEVAERLVAVQ